MFGQLGSRIKWAAVKPWLGVAGMLGAGILPCPDCGMPMIVHFWPLAAALAFYNLTKRRRAKLQAPTADAPAPAHEAPIADAQTQKHTN